ncbi:MAG: adenosylcobinamide amidohydrolase [Methanomassiliicoccaceae archaeon]|nr:adenosylcobinamide amidohydrolase [Methanomassiliicoccaceae archaeon]
MSTRQEVCGGFIVCTDASSIVISHPAGRWSVLSSSEGGYSETPDQLTLTNETPQIGKFTIKTSPDVKTASLVSKSHRMTSVSALVIADPNPSVNGDKAGGHRISVVLMVDADLPTGTMARAAITSTEAVTCAFQQLMIGRSDRKEISSGSDSICISVLSNIGCGRRLYGAGKHSKLGELIGNTVIEATISSMGKNGVTQDSQADVFKRLERFGVTKRSCREYLTTVGLVPGDGFDAALDAISGDRIMLSYVSAVLQIADEISWKLIPKAEGYKIGRKIICAAISEDASKSNDLVADIVSAIAMRALGDI